MQEAASISEVQVEPSDHWTGRFALGLAFILVMLGMANNLETSNNRGI